MANKSRQTANLVSSQTGIAVTISGDPVVLGVGNTETIRINGDGLIGIGTTKSSVNYGLEVYSEANDVVSGSIRANNSSSSSSAAALLTVSCGTGGPNAAGGALEALNNNYNSSALRGSIGLVAFSNSNSLFLATPTAGQSTRILGLNYAETARFTSDYRVGIGSTDPLVKLVVEDNVPSGTSSIYVNNTGGDAVVYLLNNDQYSAGLGTLANNGSYIELSGKWSSTNTDANRTFGRIGAFKENNTSADGAGYLALYSRPDGSALTEALRIDSSQRIGIGTTSPKGDSDFIHIFNKNGSSAYINFETAIPRVNRIGCSSYDNIDISADEDNEGGNSFVRIKVDGSEKARFIANGGITFNGDSADANALDDYEEGTWSPQITQGATVSGYADQYGWYTKIGRLVTLYFYMRFSSSGNTGDNTLFRVGNFPFAIISTGSNTTYHRGMGVSNYHSIPGFTSANISFYGGGTSNTLADVYQGSNSVTTSSALNNDYIIGGFEYFTS